MFTQINDTDLKATNGGFLADLIPQLDANRVVAEALRDRDINIAPININEPLVVVNADRPGLLHFN